MNAPETIAAAIEKLEADRVDYEVRGEWLVEVVDGCTCGGYSEATGWMHEPGCGEVPLTNDPLIVMLHRTIDPQLAILRVHLDHLNNPVYDHDEDEDFERDFSDIMSLARAILGEVTS